MSKNSSSSSSLNTQEALILGNPPPPHDLLLSTDRFDSIKKYPSLQIDSKNHSHQSMEQQRERREERMKVKSSSSITKGRSAIKERMRISVMKRKKKKMMDRDSTDRDFELMPPPGSHKKSVLATFYVDQPINPNEPTYCVCHQVSFGDMIACDNDYCQGGEWFHYSCVGLTLETRFKGKWYCPTCNLQNLQIATPLL